MANRRQRRSGSDEPTGIPYRKVGPQRWATSGTIGPLNFQVHVDKAGRTSGAVATAYVGRLYGQPPLERTFNVATKADGFREGQEVVRELAMDYIEVLRRVELAGKPENPAVWVPPLAPLEKPRGQFVLVAALGLLAFGCALVAVLALLGVFSK